MLIHFVDEQASLFDPDFYAGKMSQAPSPAGNPRERISGSSSKRSSESNSVLYMFLDLTPGAGNLLGLFYWEIRSPWRGELSTLNTGPAPRSGAAGSSLWQILEEHPHPRYYLTRKACLGILRRSAERGKELPQPLKEALEAQAGLRSPHSAKTAHKSYHINQRNEGIDLGGLSGALMATQNLQMQTFVTQPAQGVDGYNGELTGSVSSTLGTNCGMSTGRNGVLQPIGIDSKHACATGDIANTLACNCGSSTGRNGVLMMGSHQPNASIREDGISPTLTAAMGQGGGEVPVLYENHGMDSRCTGPLKVAPTVASKFGTGGNNTPLIEQPQDAFCIMGNAIDREPENGGNGIGYQEDIAYTLTATDRHAVFSRQRADTFHENDVVSTESARQHKDATDLVVQSYQQTVGTLGHTDHKGINNQYVSEDKCVIEEANLIRRLTPLECERLQGFPDGWTDIPGASDSARYKALGNSVAIPCVDFVVNGMATVLRTAYQTQKQGEASCLSQ